MKLCEQAGAVTVVLPAFPGDVTAVPAVAEQCAEAVVARPQVAGNVIGLVLHAPGIAGPAGAEDIVADALAVDLGLVEPQGGDVEARAGDRLVEAKDSAQEWHGDG